MSSDNDEVTDIFNRSSSPYTLGSTLDPDYVPGITQESNESFESEMDETDGEPDHGRIAGMNYMESKFDQLKL